MLVSVAQSDERKTDFIPISQTVVCDVPTQHVVADLVVLVPFLPPFLRRPAAERRKMKAVLFDKLLHVSDALVDL